MQPDHTPPIRVEAVNRPACVSRLAALMLRLHLAQNARPALRLVQPASNEARREEQTT